MNWRRIRYKYLGTRTFDKRWNYTILVILVCVVSLLAYVWFTAIKVPGPIAGGVLVAEGDLVSVNYIGMFDDGSVFDTSYEEVARDDSVPKAELFELRPAYEPLSFTVGMNQVVKGFDEGVKGMRIGEEKNLVIPPSEAYGEVDETLIERVLRTQEVSRTQEISRTAVITLQQFNQFFGKEPELGETLSSTGAPWNETVVNITNTSVTVEREVSIGMIVQFSNLPWDSTIISINEENMTVQHNTKEGEIFTIPNAPWNLTITRVTDANMTVYYTGDSNTTINTIFGPVKIGFTEDSIIIDKNSPLAGETLTFKVTVVNITKPVNASASMG